MVYIWLCIMSWEFSTLSDTWIEKQKHSLWFLFLHANVKASGCGATGRHSALALWIAPMVNVTYFHSKQKAESKVCRQKSFHFQRERWLQLCWFPWRSSGKALGSQLLRIVAVLVDLRQRSHKPGPFVAPRDCDLLWREGEKQSV